MSRRVPSLSLILILGALLALAPVAAESPGRGQSASPARPESAPLTIATGADSSADGYLAIGADALRRTKRDELRRRGQFSKCIQQSGAHARQRIGR